ncbi:MAG: 3-dehydroquinate dehydratase [Bacilli bacterium]|jgi:3-dehydroquinate dehydratase-2|nr:3-dehydroquinate dehydratase [Bacilli bacterium]
MNLKKEIRIKIINGPNLNMLEYRNNDLYGSLSLKSMINEINNQYKDDNIKLDWYQSNYEGAIIDVIHQLIKNNNYDALIINGGALTHYSYALRDALEILNIIKVEVHLSNIKDREDFRKIDVINDVCDNCFMGNKINSYYEAIDYILKRMDEINEEI